MYRLVAALLTFICLGVSAQTDTTMQIYNSKSQFSNLKSQIIGYDYLKSGDPWLTGPNAAALERYCSDSRAKAEVTMTRGKGGFTNFNASPDLLQADADVQSFFRLNDHTVVYGQMGYRNFSGHDMAGSSFIDGSLLGKQRHLPFDIVEDSLGNTGTKHLDAYHLLGAVSTQLRRLPLPQGTAIGFSLDYTAANYAKYKDLRHKNKLMDMTVSAGLYLPLCRYVQMGATYLYRRTTESLQFSTYGKSDINYVSLINYGPYIGQTEQFGSSGYTDKSRELPLVDNYDGLTLQLSLSPLTSHHSPLTTHLSPHTTPPSPLPLYTSFTYAHRRGYYGRRSPYTITFTNHDSHVYRFDARLSLTTPRARLYTSLSLNAENLENLSRNRRELKNDAGATHYEYYTPTKTANHLWVDGEVNVTAHLLPLADEPLTTPGTVPQWTVQGGLRWAHQKQTAWVYPYCRRQHFTTYEPFLELERNLLTHHGIWTLGASMALRHGHGTPAADTTLIPPSDKQTPPPTMETYLWREWQWMNAAQYELGASVRYAFTTHLLSMTTQQLFVRGAVTHRKCNERNAFTAGPDHTTMTVTIGCEF